MKPSNSPANMAALALAPVGSVLWDHHDGVPSWISHRTLVRVGADYAMTRLIGAGVPYPMNKMMYRVSFCNPDRLIGICVYDSIGYQVTVPLYPEGVLETDTPNVGSLTTPLPPSPRPRLREIEATLKALRKEVLDILEPLVDGDDDPLWWGVQSHLGELLGDIEDAGTRAGDKDYLFAPPLSAAAAPSNDLNP